MAHILSMEYASPWIKLFHFTVAHFWILACTTPRTLSVAVPGTCLRPRTWPSSPTPLSFLQHSDHLTWSRATSPKRGHLIRALKESTGNALEKKEKISDSEFFLFVCFGFFFEERNILVSIKSMKYWSTNPLEFIILVNLSLSFPWCP